MAKIWGLLALGVVVFALLNMGGPPPCFPAQYGLACF
jgi:hypothetical protein